MKKSFRCLSDFIFSNLRAARLDARTAQKKGNAHIKLKWKAFAFDQTKLTQMIAMVGRVEDVCVVEFAQALQLLVDALDRNVDTLQRLQALCHQKVGEFAMNRLHFVGVTEDPLLVGIGREVVGRCAVWMSE